jgi:hypothetical protein
LEPGGETFNQPPSRSRERLGQAPASTGGGTAASTGLVDELPIVEPPVEVPPAPPPLDDSPPESVLASLGRPAEPFPPPPDEPPLAELTFEVDAAPPPLDDRPVGAVVVPVVVLLAPDGPRAEEPQPWMSATAAAHARASWGRTVANEV